MVSQLLASPEDVVRCLLTYTDWWQPATSSILQAGAARRHGNGDGIRAGLLETLDERTELCHRVALLKDQDRRLLFLWYVQLAETIAIARALGISLRQCFRRRASAIRAIVELGEDEDAA